MNLLISQRAKARVNNLKYRNQYQNFYAEDEFSNVIVDCFIELSLINKSRVPTLREIDSFLRDKNSEAAITENQENTFKDKFNEIWKALEGDKVNSETENVDILSFGPFHTLALVDKIKCLNGIFTQFNGLNVFNVQLVDVDDLTVVVAFQPREKVDMQVEYLQDFVEHFITGTDLNIIPEY